MGEEIMGTCEEMGSSVETQNEVNLGISSSGDHKEVDHNDYHQLTEEEILAQQFESVVLEANGYGYGDDHQLTEGEILAQQFENVVLQVSGYEVGIRGEEDDKGEEKEGQEKLRNYPLRPYAVDCSFYLKTGTCKFGENCRFNHPPERAFQPVLEQERGAENNGTMVDPGKIDCKYFRTPGGCKYGDACRYNHSAKKVDKEIPELNFLGLPVRPSEQECTFYLRTGSCGYGASCRYHHPEPTAAKETEPRNSLANDVYVRGGNDISRMYVPDLLQSTGVPQGITELPNGINSMNGLPYGGMSSYHQAMPQNGGWNQDQVNHSLSAKKKASLPHQIMNNYSKNIDPSTHYEQVMQSEEFPVRPGQPDCDFFLKTGDCKYRAACRYNHPVSRGLKLRLPVLGSKGPYPKSKNPELPNSNPGNTRKNGTSSHMQQQMQNGQYPERPGLAECEYFMKTGSCKFKAACKFHHPRDRMSTSSPCALSASGLPLRPGSKICRNYELQGMCKYGRNCLFHHPDEGTRAIPVAPVADQEDHSSSALVAADFESPADNNVESDWGDGWVM